MADLIYEIKENPVYETEIRALQDSDKAQASTVFNPLLERIINNTHAVKKEAEETANRIKYTQYSSLNDIGLTDEDIVAENSLGIICRAMPPLSNLTLFIDANTTWRGLLPSSGSSYAGMLEITKIQSGRTPIKYYLLSTTGNNNFRWECEHRIDGGVGYIQQVSEWRRIITNNEVKYTEYTSVSQLGLSTTDITSLADIAAVMPNYSILVQNIASNTTPWSLLMPQNSNATLTIRRNHTDNRIDVEWVRVANSDTYVNDRYYAYIYASTGFVSGWRQYHTNLSAYSKEEVDTLVKSASLSYGFARLETTTPTWYKFAEFTQSVNNSNINVDFIVSGLHGGAVDCITAYCTLKCRNNSESKRLAALSYIGNVEQYKITAVMSTNTTGNKVKLYAYIPTQYRSLKFTFLNISSRQLDSPSHEITSTFYNKLEETPTPTVDETIYVLDTSNASYTKSEVDELITNIEDNKIMKYYTSLEELNLTNDLVTESGLPIIVENMPVNSILILTGVPQAWYTKKYLPNGSSPNWMKFEKYHSGFAWVTLTVTGNISYQTTVYSIGTVHDWQRIVRETDVLKLEEAYEDRITEIEERVRAYENMNNGLPATITGGSARQWYKLLEVSVLDNAFSIVNLNFFLSLFYLNTLRDDVSNTTIAPVAYCNLHCMGNTSSSIVPRNFTASSVIGDINRYRITAVMSNPTNPTTTVKIYAYMPSSYEKIRLTMLNSKAFDNSESTITYFTNVMETPTTNDGSSTYVLDTSIARNLNALDLFSGGVDGASSFIKEDIEISTAQSADNSIAAVEEDKPIIPFLVGAIKELKIIVDELKKEIDERNTNGKE